eukprot:CAMPEP_0172316826 /NCGR_PEP_ID=MMETSP1058-20130122/29654_1 /TAXON_ID=83371 /ORGANISM="Detonula confervacea, Strain CCMP 353" /LENGTH=308 /DNA_ID=CAMNT_0013031241 /DNA_START=275 /DNA_END=1201 /DNA_ORIENTATION=+
MVSTCTTTSRRSRHSPLTIFDSHSSNHLINHVEYHPAPTQEVDWKLYALQQKYKRAGGVLYKQSILTPHEYAIIVNELQSLNLKLMEEDGSSFATNRVGAQIASSSEIYRVLSSCGDDAEMEEGSLCRLINRLADQDDFNDENNIDCREFGKMILAPDIPIEIRVYEKTGAGMEWHIDDILYQPEQIEVVLTLENTSDCSTMWKPHDQQLSAAESDNNNDGHYCEQEQHHHPPKYAIQSAQTTPNSALILKAGGVEHKVSPLTVGKRTILKMAFVREGAVIERGMEEHASHHAGKKKKTQRRSKSGKR